MNGQPLLLVSSPLVSPVLALSLLLSLALLGGLKLVDGLFEDFLLKGEGSSGLGEFGFLLLLGGGDVLSGLF
jgi:hypothetical protein